MWNAELVRAHVGRCFMRPGHDDFYTVEENFINTGRYRLASSLEGRTVINPVYVSAVDLADYMNNLDLKL